MYGGELKLCTRERSHIRTLQVELLCIDRKCNRFQTAQVRGETDVPVFFPEA